MGNKQRGKTKKRLVCQYGRFDPLSGKCNRRVEGVFKARKGTGAGVGVPVCNRHLWELRQREADDAGWYKIRASDETM